jgi:hypothetical protein
MSVAPKFVRRIFEDVKIPTVDLPSLMSRVQLSVRLKL